MPLTVSLKSPVTGPPAPTKLPFPVPRATAPFPSSSRRRISLSSRALRPAKAVEGNKEGERGAEEEASVEEEGREIGAEIRKAMEERRSEKEGKGTMSFSGVAEEIGEIEWPGFGKVLGTTGVVLGVIAGSSVVLLTVNAVLAELSDRVFAGKGVQDFFS